MWRFVWYTNEENSVLRKCGQQVWKAVLWTSIESNVMGKLIAVCCKNVQAVGWKSVRAVR